MLYIVYTEIMGYEWDAKIGIEDCFTEKNYQHNNCSSILETFGNRNLCILSTKRDTEYAQ